MKNNDCNKNVEEFMKWSKVCIITAIITVVFSIIPALLTILNEFTDLGAKMPYLYSKILAWIMLVIFLALVTFEIFCYVKARKYKKLIEKIENNKSEDTTEQSDSDNSI